ncbi:DUF2691 family protein [Priestia taiwanensis]|uniref:Uncharacterized protein n=1 Tax=Priestia taiwanensis TaxID=1347902 RepID=A0A917AXZ3_9BACI|nr:DUF2691 family protein [Priestia taiwanensis]MBM7365250.1 cellulose synthase/poly-beta-1,6-N-acetylglucosamine synthase-like glycosyltransferase [Priestia taiwanensis]GGE85332.1 hypothetical protein GCM10007140_38510 [Priestia taiwanensis]
MDVTIYHWKNGGEESYIVRKQELVPLFSEDEKVIDGFQLRQRMKESPQYLIFLSLQAYRTEEVQEVKTYEEFLESDCELIFRVIDSSYITMYVKDQEQIERLYVNAKNYGFENVSYITDENDCETTLTVWG